MTSVRAHRAWSSWLFLAAAVAACHPCLALTYQRIPHGPILVADRDAAARCAIVTALFPAGPAYEGPAAGTGASHALEHLLGRRFFMAATPLPAVPATGTFTTRQGLSIQFAVAPDNIQEACRTLVDCLHQAASGDVDAAGLRHVLQLEAARPKSLDRLAYDAICARLFPGHPFGQPIGGTPSQIQKLTHDALADIARRVLAPAGSIWAVVSPLPEAEALSRLRSGLADWLSQPPAARRYSPPRPPASPLRASVVVRRGGTAAVAYAWRVGGPSAPWYPAQRLLLAALCQPATISRHFPPGAGVLRAGIQLTCFGGDFAYAIYACPQKQAHQLAEALTRYLEALASGRIRIDPRLARRAALANLSRARCDAAAWSSLLAQRALLAGSPDLLAEMERRIGACTESAVQQAAAAALSPQRSPAAMAVFPPQASSSPLCSATAGSSRQLPNGARIVAWRHRGRGWFCAALAVAGGAAAEVGLPPFIARAAAVSAIHSPLTNGKSLATLCAEWGGSASAHASGNHIAIRVSAPRDAAELLLPALAQIACRPPLDDAGIAAARRAAEQKWLETRAAPTMRATCALARALLPSSSVAGRDQPFDPSTISADAILSYWSRTLAPHQTCLAAAGEFSESALDKAAAQLSQALQRPLPQIQQPSPASAPGKIVLPITGSRSAVAIGFAVPELSALQTAALLLVQSASVGGPGAGGSELRWKLRRHGLAYSVSFRHYALGRWGLLVICAEVRPGRESEAARIIQQAMSNLRDNGLPGDVAAQAERYCRVRLALQAADLETWVRAAARAALAGQPNPLDEGFLRHLSAVRQQLRRLIRQLLDPARSAMVILQAPSSGNLPR